MTASNSKNMKSKIYSNQTNTSSKICQSFIDNNWTMLVQPMMSGKTGTYYHTGFEMYRYGYINYMNVICGSSEKILKTQTIKDFDEQLSAYMDHLIEKEKENYSETRDLIKKIKNNTQILFSNDLIKKKNQKIKKKTLITWDESHAAQDKINRPNKYLKNCGINANGNQQYLKEREIYVLSVSATPFSEFSDVKHFNQTKKMILGEIGETYVSVEHYYTNNQICGFKNPIEKLKEILDIHPVTKNPKYAIVRITEKDSKEVDKIFTENNWDVKIYNGKVKDIENLDVLEIKPKKNTAIIIKGMCRMGKKVPKTHISFVMEFSKNPNTDTVLQGLLGRMCGYHNNKNIMIYLSEKILKSEEFTRYINFTKGDEIIPDKAKNINSNKKSSDSEWNNTIIQKIILHPEESKTSETEKESKEEDELITKEQIRRAIRDDKNCPEQSEDLYKQLHDPSTIFKIRSTRAVTYEGVPFNISESYNKNEISKVSSQAGCGFDLNTENYVNVWFIHKDYPEFSLKKGDLFIDMRTKVKNPEILYTEKMPKTTTKESFHGDNIIDEDGNKTESNGSHTMNFPCETADNVKLMEKCLSSCIELSNDPKYPFHNVRQIKSEKSANSEWVGIVVSPEVLKALKKSGSVYKTIFEKYNVKLDTSSISKSQKAKKLKEDYGYITLTRIKW